MKVINLFGGPCSGKSTLAAGLFYEMKLQGRSVELCTEYAKDLTYEKHEFGLNNQLMIFAEQYTRLKRLENHVDYVICDSPLLLTLAYQQFYDNTKLHLTDTVLSAIDEFQTGKHSTLNYFIERDLNKEYDERGRNQTLFESIHLDNFILDNLNTFSESYIKLQQNCNPKLLSMAF